MMIGNLSIEDIENRVSFTFPDELKKFMQETHQSNISKGVAPGKWHCFDIPFSLVCGDMATAIKIADYLRDKQSDSKCYFTVSVVKNKEKKD